MTTDALGVPAHSLKACGSVFTLRFYRHRIEGDIVGIVEQDQVVELEVSGKGGCLAGHALLQAPVPGECEYVVVKNCVFGSIKAGGCHLA